MLQLIHGEKGYLDSMERVSIRQHFHGLHTHEDGKELHILVPKRLIKALCYMYIWACPWIEQSSNTLVDCAMCVHGNRVALLQILMMGFKSNRKFGKRLFLWDLMERVCEHMSASEVPIPVVNTAPLPGSSDRQLLCNTVSRINSNYTHIGKQEKVRRETEVWEVT